MILKELNSGWAKRILSFLNQFSFLLGNVFLFLLFREFVSNPAIIFLASVVFAFLIIGRLYDFREFLWWLITLVLLFFVGNPYVWIAILIWFIASIVLLLRFILKRTNKKSDRSLSIYLIAKMIIVFPKILFFSISHIIFPLLLIWISMLGIFYVVGLTTISNFSNMATIVGILGLLSGFYQFYVERYDEKIQKKIVRYFTSFIIPKEKLGIKEFKKFIADKDKYKSIRTNLENFETGMLTFLSNMRQFQNSQNVFLNLVPGQDETAYFIFLEQKAQNNKTLNKQLKDAYNDFFDEKKNEILQELKSKDINELKWLLLGNINILEEAQASLSSLDFEECSDPNYYAEYVKNLYFQVFDEVFETYIFN